MDILDNAGNLIGVADRDNGKPDLIIIDGKQMTETELRADKELFDAYNNDVQSAKVDLND